MKIGFLSDTHSLSLRLYGETFGDLDLLVHSGDFTNSGRIDSIKRFGRQLGMYIQARHIVVVPGNHDFAFASDTANARQALTDAFNEFNHNHERQLHILIDQAVRLYDGERHWLIYGSPWQPWFHDWAFNFPNPATRSHAEVAEISRVCWSQIPGDTDILVTHSPPYGINDLSHSGYAKSEDLHAGCPQLLARTKVVRPRYHSYGHIHESRGVEFRHPTWYINAASAVRHERTHTEDVIMVDTQVSEQPVRIQLNAD